MDTVLNVKKVSLLFFLTITGTHLFASLMIANGYSEKWIQTLSGVLDLPAILAGVLYAFTSSKLYLEQIGKPTHIFDVIAGIIAGIILILSFYFNFFI